MIENRPVRVFGDGETSRDFCFVDNAVQVNLLAALNEESRAINPVFNVAVGDRISLNQLFDMSKEFLMSHFPHVAAMHPCYDEFRLGDVRHSQADISKAMEILGYAPTHRVAEGLHATVNEFVRAHTKEAQGHEKK